jgi:hypothetical protein
MTEQAVNSLAIFGLDLGRLFEHQSPNLVRRSDFGQMHVRFEANLFKVWHPIVRQHVIEIFSHRVRIEPHSARVDLGRTEP